MATAATVPTRTPATEQARKPGGTRSRAPLRPPAPLKASQLPIIRLAASLGDSLSSDTEKPSDRELMFVSGRRGAVITTLLQDMPHTYARRGAPAAQPDLDRTVGLISCLPRWSATEPHGASRRCRPSRSTRTPSGGGNHHPAVVGLPGQVFVAIDACNGAPGHRGQSDYHRPGDCPAATWRTIAMISCTISPRAPPVAAPLSRYSNRGADLRFGLVRVHKIPIVLV